MNKQTERFPFNPPINLPEGGNWLLAVTSFEATNSVFNITNENNGFSISTPSHWISESAEKTIDELNKLLELLETSHKMILTYLLNKFVKRYSFS